MNSFLRSRVVRGVSLSRLVQIAAAIGLMSAACGEPSAPPAPVATVVLSPATTVELVPGGSETIQAIPKDAAGNQLTNRETTWSSSDPAIVTVAAGIATGVALGSATITATIEMHSASVEVVVREGGVVAPTGSSFTAISGAVSLAVPAGAVTAKRNVTVTPANGGSNPRVVAGSAFDFGPATLTFAQPATLTLKYDPSKVDSDSPESGLQLYELVAGSWRLVTGSTVDVTAKTVTGAVTHLGTYAVLMQPRVETVTIDHDGESVRVARTLQFNAVLKDIEGQTLNRPIVWSTSNADILRIDATTGLATGVYPGDAVVTATSEKKSATARITVVSGPAASIAAQAGNGQTAALNAAVSVPPSVKVVDAENVPVKGVTVTFAVASGGGSVTGANAVTDINGIAAVGSWIVGPLPGTNTLTATSGTLSGSPVTFTATGIAPVPEAIFINGGDGQSVFAGTAVPIPPSVKVVDAHGGPVPGVTVTFTIRSGTGSITGATPTTNAQGIATLGSWTVGMGGNSLFAAVPGTTYSPLVFVAIGNAHVQLITFGDSNTDLGFAGTDPVFKVASYVSGASSSLRLAPDAPNSSLQLAGKVESRWKTSRPSLTIRVVNHAIAGTTTGNGRTALIGSPNAREIVNGIPRFAGEVLGAGYPWSGGEPQNGIYPNGPILRTQAFRPRAADFVYISMGTNDIGDGFTPDAVAANLEWMIDQWIAAGLAADHLMMSTLPPRQPSTTNIPALNAKIRAFAAKGIKIIELVGLTSTDDGFSWRTTPPQPYVSENPRLHYSETIRDQLADLIVAYMSSKTP